MWALAISVAVLAVLSGGNALAWLALTIVLVTLGLLLAALSRTR
jgi:hypothetical protein